MKKIALLMMLIFSMTLFTGCFGPPAANAMTVSQEKIWPADIPASVPKVEEGKITKVTTLLNSTLVELGDVTAEDYADYIEKVESAGWELLFESGETSEAYKKDEARLDVTFIENKMTIDFSKSINDTPKTQK